MYFSTNLQHLRKTNGNMTQEKLAERMGVSRQTISKWESGEAYSELTKHMELCGIFSCKLDALLRDDMCARANIYSPVSIVHLEGFRMARYVMITPQPENDVNAYLDNWARRSGLLDFPGYTPKRIGWDFPFVSNEQRNRFGLRGYVAAYVLPDGFEPTCYGTEITSQEAADYATITIREPFAAAFERIPHACQLILEYLNCNGFKENTKGDFLCYFEWVYEKDGVEYMDVYIHTDSVAKANLHAWFS